MTRRIAVLGRARSDEADVSDEAIARRLAAGEPFWLDLHGLDDDDLALLRDTFGLHPLVLEDVQRQGQRAKVEEYGDMTYIVAFGATPPPDHDRLVEVHLLYSEHFLVTLHRDASPAIDDVVRRCSIRPELLEKGPHLLYRVLDALTDSFFPAMDELDSDIDEIDSALSTSPRDGLQGEIFELRRRVVALRRAVTPQRDQISRIATGAVELPGVDADARRYFRDVEDHLIRIAELLDGYRDLLAGANDVYLATVSNRLNAVTKQLTVIAGIFLPLSFITGFFGQNFGWMVDHVGGPGAFFGLGDRPSGRRRSLCWSCCFAAPGGSSCGRRSRLPFLAGLGRPGRTAIGLRVMKFGGSSVADADKIKNVARRIAEAPRAAATTSSRSCRPAARRPTASSPSRARSPTGPTRARWTCCCPPASASPAP